MTFDLNAMLKQAQEMQQRLAKAQEDAAQKTVEASAGGGMVTVEMTGAFEVKRLRIDPQAVDPKDPTLLQDLLIAAFNQGIAKAKELQAGEMRAATGGLAIPGLPF